MGERSLRLRLKKTSDLAAGNDQRLDPAPIRINLGCGDKVLPGYINVDTAYSRRERSPDVVADLRSIPFDDNFADEAIAIHVIEHFYLWEAADVLLEWRRILKPGGRLVLECPNILEAARQLVKRPDLAVERGGKSGQTVMWPLYGDPGWRDPLMCHKWGYTPDSLKFLLSDLSFRDVRQAPALFKKGDPRDMRIEATK